MCELSQLDAVFLAKKALITAAVFHVVDLYRLVALGRHAKLARVVEVDRKNGRSGSGLLNILPYHALRESAAKIHATAHLHQTTKRTFIGRKFMITSLTLDANGTVPSVRVMFSAGPPAGSSISIGTDTMFRRAISRLPNLVPGILLGYLWWVAFYRRQSMLCVRVV